MNIKNVWILFFISLFVAVPIKIYSSLMQNSWHTQPAFIAVVLVLVGLLIVSIMLCKNFSEIMSTKRNIGISILSAALFICFILCGIYYFKDDSSYDFELQPLVMSLLSFLSSVSFLFIFLTNILKKNMFKKASFLVFGPVIWYCVKMIMFLSLSNNNPNIYDIILKSLLLLFFVYQTQIFISSTGKNIPKRLFIFGLPAVFASLIHNLSEIISGLCFNISNLNLAINITEIFCSIYILFVL
ncbi:MAG: hypothetical protein LBR79_03090, partial [Oscillospiraceae bacterium]|nr:hypothetical protein [Oscillospiraceae bacterium]